MYKKIASVVLMSLLIATLGISGCIDSSEPHSDLKIDSNKIIVIDDAKRTVEVPKNIEKIATLNGALREVVYFGEQEKVIGLEFRESSQKTTGAFPSSFDLPYIIAYPELRNLPPIRTGSDINFEGILKAQPDVIIIGSFSKADADSLQEKVGIPVVVIYVDSIGTDAQNQRYFESVETLGKVLRKENRAKELISLFKGYEDDLKNRVKNIPESERPTVYVGGRAYNGAHGILGTDPKWPPFTLINANNIASGLSDESMGIYISKEELLNKNPDYIFLSAASKHKISEDLKEPTYKELSAFSNENVYMVPPYCWYFFNKEHALINAYFIGSIVYPEEFKDIVIEEKADEIYKNFLGKPIYDEIMTHAFFVGHKKMEID
ncbi:periplasmic binding protein [Methanococcus vannielii SB]|uniref:Periplasmic binding protein n=1 Tax=Methanococcus vannielii (strain ATCC 35089 / DSM 1224 / JCM 13029 / OCM 148 / SB) TaxID=406327 RepID=A6UPI2_METVS|nr:iron ABC transporter substrate-binding protein [Methanococcus vannielii]ABR54404.1 periplasmic binding protein [Methanococcus vannielii SB]